MGIVLDSSILIGTHRRKFDWVGWSASIGEQELLITTVTLSELLHGFHRAQTEEQRNNRQRLISMIERDYRILSFGIGEARFHADLTAKLQVRGISIGAHDVMIAAIAGCNGHQIATLNAGEFQRIPNVTVLDVSAYSMT